MRKPHIHTMKITNKIKDETGSIIVITVFIVLILSILIAGMVEIGRVMIVREQLQTATDSAALAGAGTGTHRYVKINVVTVRGEREVKTKKGSYCKNCSDITVHNIPGDEKTLIEDGGWREYCVEPCDCGGGDCYFQLVSRDLGYDTQSMGWGISQNEIDSVENDLTIATREALSESNQIYSSTLYQVFANKTLSQMDQMLSNSYVFLSPWMAAGGYSYDCPCDYRGRPNAACLAWKGQGYQVFNDLKLKEPNVARTITMMNNMKTANNRGITKVDSQYTAAVGKFFNTNLPANATDAGIQKIKVYGYESRNNAATSKYYPSVVVYAKAQIKTLFPQWFKGAFKTTTCASGSTTYRSAEDQISKGNKFYGALSSFGKWNRVPDDACWVDW